MWSAYAAVDDFFDASEAVKHYHEEIHGAYRPDPIAAGRIDVNQTYSTPREYFLSVFESQIQMITREWRNIVPRFKKAVEEYVFCASSIHDALPLSPQTPYIWSINPPQAIILSFRQYALSVNEPQPSCFTANFCRDVVGFCLLANSSKTEKSGVIYSPCLQIFLNLGKRSIKYSNSTTGLLKWQISREC